MSTNQANVSFKHLIVLTVVTWLVTYIGGFGISSTYLDNYSNTLDPETGVVPFVLWFWFGWFFCLLASAFSAVIYNSVASEHSWFLLGFTSVCCTVMFLGGYTFFLADLMT